MMDAHTLAVAGFVSQATFALTFALLAWTDRRTRGMMWLAAAGVLQLTATSVRLVRPYKLTLEDPAGAALLILLFFFVYMGLRWFAVRRGLRSRSGPAVLALCIGSVVLLSLFNPNAALLAGRIVALVIIGCTVRMLWSSRVMALRGPLRASSILLSILGAVMAVRMVMLALWPRMSATRANDDLRTAMLVTIVPLFLSFLGLFVAETNRRLHDETRLDVLTGLRNRRALEEAASREARHCSMTQAPLALMMMDLDHFKQLNDTWGHGLGDRALRAMGSVLLTIMGDSAVTARMGGEEFAALLPGYDLHAATEVAERIRASVEDLRLAEGQQLARFTVSVGVTVLQPGERTWAEMMARADEALYRAKREGRNRVATSAGTEPADGPRQRSVRRSSWKQLLLPKQGPML